MRYAPGRRFLWHPLLPSVTSWQHRSCYFATTIVRSHLVLLDAHLAWPTPPDLSAHKLISLHRRWCFIAEDDISSQKMAVHHTRWYFHHTFHHTSWSYLTRIWLDTRHQTWGSPTTIDTTSARLVMNRQLFARWVHPWSGLLLKVFWSRFTPTFREPPSLGQSSGRRCVTASVTHPWLRITMHVVTQEYSTFANMGRGRTW